MRWKTFPTFKMEKRFAVDKDEDIMRPKPRSESRHHAHFQGKYFKGNKHKFCFDIRKDICHFPKLIVFLELPSRQTVSFLER